MTESYDDKIYEGKVLLNVEELFLNFGGITALCEVSLAVKKGELLALIGPNGAGKSSLLNCINGFYHPQRGEIYFKGKRITKLSPSRIAGFGINRVFQNIELFSGMTTVDNLMAARHVHMKRGFLAGAIYYGWCEKEEVEHRKKVEEIIDFLEIKPIRNEVVGNLSYGMRKRVDLGRALAGEPELLLLDEPMAGMNIEEKEDMARFILDEKILKGTTVVMVEHDMGVVMDIADRVYVLDFGKVIAEGSPEEVKNNDRVIKAYLGLGEES